MTDNLYDLIGEAIDEDGHLIKEPEIPLACIGEATFAPGAKDGIFLYHHAMTDPDKTLHLEYAIAALEEANAGNQDMAMEYARKMAEEGSVIQMADEIHEYIGQHHEELNKTRIFTFGYHLVLSATLPEQMKLGLNLLELFQTDQQEALRDLVIHCAYSDEFTLSSAYIVKNWHDASDVMFRLVQEVHGWGRVHLVRMIPCEDRPDIQRWLLLHGIENGVHAGYSAGNVYCKTDFDNILANHPDDELYTAMLKVLAALLGEGPQHVSGQELFEHIAEIIRDSLKERHLNEAQEQVLDVLESELTERGLVTEVEQIKALRTVSLS